MPSPIDIFIRSQAKLDALNKANAGLNSLTGAAQRFLSLNLATKLAGAFSAAAFGAFFTRAIQTADAMGKMAQKVGIAVQSLSGFAHAARLADVNSTELQAGIKQLADVVSRAAQGNREALNSFGQLGVSFQNADGTLKSSEQLLFDIADRFQELPDGIQKTAVAVDVFGRAGAEMIPLLNQGSAALRDQIREAEEFGLVVGPEFTNRAQTFNDQLTRIKGLFEGLFLRLADALLPELNRFLEWILRFTRETGAHIGLLNTLIDIYKTFAIVGTELAGAFQALGVFLGQFSGALAESSDPFLAWRVATEAFNESLAETERSVARIINLAPSVPGAAPGSQLAQALKGPVELRREFEERRKSIDLEITENRIRQERIRLGLVIREGDEVFARDATKRQGELNRLLAQEVELLQGRGALLTEARQQNLLPFQEAEQFRVQDSADFLDTERRLQELSQNDFAGRLRANMQALGQEWAFLGRNMADVFTRGVQGAVDATADSILGLIEGTKNWGQAFAQVARQVVFDLIRIAIQAALVRFVLAPLKLGGLFGFAKGGSVPAFASGGLIPGAPSSRDNRLAAVATGEYVVNAQAVAFYGPKLLEAINSFKLPKLSLDHLRFSVSPSPRLNFASGGLVGAVGGSQPVINLPAPVVQIGVIRTRNEAREFLESGSGHKFLFDLVSGMKTQLGIAS